MKYEGVQQHWSFNMLMMCLCLPTCCATGAAIANAGEQVVLPLSQNSVPIQSHASHMSHTSHALGAIPEALLEHVGMPSDLSLMMLRRATTKDASLRQSQAFSNAFVASVRGKCAFLTLLITASFPSAFHSPP